MDTATRRLPLTHPFNLHGTLDLNTQDFRWQRWPDGSGVKWHSGVLRGHLIHVSQDDGVLQYHASGNADCDDLLRAYFRLDEDIDITRNELASVDTTMAELTRRFPHMRVLRQPDPWETTVAFICTATTSIKGTKTRVERIASQVGSPLVLAGNKRWSFPSPRTVLEREQCVKKLRLGLDRESKILGAAARVCGDGTPPLDLDTLAQPGVPYPEARWQLLFSRGIGPKVADCISLFALDKPEAFPVDRWVREAVKRNYFPDGKLPSGDDLVRWGQERFGRAAGYASQLLFLDGYPGPKTP